MKFNDKEKTILSKYLNTKRIDNDLKLIIMKILGHYDLMMFGYTEEMRPIVQIVCDEWEIPVEVLRLRTGLRPIVYARFTLMDYLRRVKMYTVTDAGAYFGKSHSNASLAIKKVGEMRRFDKEFAAKYEMIMKKISEIQN